MTPSDRFIAQACDPRLAPLAFAATPAWLWSADGARILWCNAMAGAYFGAASPSILMTRPDGAGAAAGREVAALFGRLPMDGKPQLARLRTLAESRMRTPLTCACRRLRTADREAAILVTATEPPKQVLPLAERVSRVLQGGADLAAFDAEGALVFVGDAAAARLSGLTLLACLGAAPATTTPGEIPPVRSTIDETQLYRFGDGDAEVTVARILATATAPDIEPTAPTEVAGHSDHDGLPTAGAPAPASPQPSRADGNDSDIAALEEIAARLIARRHPLRFVWRMDAEGAFNVQEGEFTTLSGEPTAALQGRSWDEVSARLDLDPQGAVARAIAARDTWSGVHVAWPVQGTDETLPVALSGLPVLDAGRGFRGYRGFGVCRDIERIAAAIAARRAQLGSAAAAPEAPPATSGTRSAEGADDDRPADVFSFASPREARATLTLVPLAKNVVPLRAGITSEMRPGLSPVEQNAFQEIARALGARLEGETASVVQMAPSLPPNAGHEGPSPDRDQAAAAAGIPERAILDRIPNAIVAFRADQMLFVNRPLLDWTKMESLEAIAAAGGLDALFVHPAGPQPNDVEAKPRTLLLRRADGQATPVEAQLVTLSIANAPAAMLILARAEEKASAPPLRRAHAPRPGSEEMRGILDLVADAIVLVERSGRVAFANARAASLFGYDRQALLQASFLDLFSPESRRAVIDCIDQRKVHNGPEQRSGGCEVTGRTRQGATVPLSMTLARSPDDPGEVCAVFRDLTPTKQAEQDVIRAKRRAEETSSAASELLTTISHEIRTPLNAVVGFAEIMAEERLGPMGNDRYHGYARDIHASARQMVALLDDVLDLSKLEAGRFALSFAKVDLNDTMQQCVAIVQPQAQRERIIIRTALAPALPQVLADARSVRQILLNLLSNAIKFTGAGGQVILSTAVTDAGEAVLRVRDTGIGMSENEIATALEPFRKPQTDARAGVAGGGLGLSLTRALAEANHAQFRIKSAINSGTLVEIVFPAEQMVTP